MAGTPSKMVMPSRWMAASTVAGSNRGTSDIVQPNRTQTFRMLDRPKAGQAEDVEERQHREDDIVGPDLKQAAGDVSIHIQLHVRQLGALRTPSGSRGVDHDRGAHHEPLGKRGRGVRHEPLERDGAGVAVRGSHGVDLARHGACAPRAASSRDTRPGDEDPRSGVLQVELDFRRLEQHFSGTTTPPALSIPK